MTTHLEETLERDLNHLRSRMTAMAGMAVWALEQCVVALRDRNRRVAYAVILRDQRIDDLEKEVDRLCQEFLIRHQPVGMQLRFVYSAIKINAGLERIGDYAESIARQILKTVDLQPPAPVDRFVEIAGLVIPMLQAAVKAYLHQDAALARATAAVEVQADALRNRINAEVMAWHQRQQLPLEALTPLLTIVRRFERVSDQAKNFCEEAVYVCTGEAAKHPGSDVWRILFVAEDLACLAPMAGAIGAGLQLSRLQFESAGWGTRGVDPFTRDFLAGKGLGLPVQAVRKLEDLGDLSHYQVVVGLGSVDPALFSGLAPKAVALHWGIPDPTQTSGTTEQLHAAHEECFRLLAAQIRDLADAILGDGSG